MNESKIGASKAYNRIGTALFATAALTCGIQFLLGFLYSTFFKGSNSFNSNWYIWLASFVPLYAVGIPVGIGIMKKVPCEQRDTVKLGGKNFFIFLLMCFPLMYGGNILGVVLSSLFSGGTAENKLNNYLFDSSPLKIIVVVILAPLLEEFIFRKQLIDRCGRYGEKTAILFSALAFGLFHMNLFQFFYAFALGWLFAYVYTRTRRLRYSVIMHMVINFIGSVLAPLMLSSLDMDALNQMSQGVIDEAAALTMLPALVGFMLYVLVLLGFVIAGLVLICKKASKLVFLPAEEEIPAGQRFKTVYCNAGTILFTLFCIAMSIFNFI